MAIVNEQTSETFLKVLYVGCAGCGKSTNIQWLFKQTSAELPSKHFDLGSFSKNNSAFEFLPILLEGEKKVRLQLVFNACTQFVGNCATAFVIRR